MKDSNISTDAITRKEINVQYFQAVFHFLTASIITFGVPSHYLQNTIPTTLDMLSSNKSPESLFVHLTYLLSTTYHCVLYFWDPMTNTSPKPHHLISIFIGTILLIYNNIALTFLLMLIVYLIDFKQFVKIAIQNKKRLLVMSMIKIHHMVTLMLLGLSWTQNFTACGIWILFVHDLTDVPMFMIRILRRKNLPFTKQFFVAVVVMWMWLYYRVWCLFFFILEVLRWYGQVERPFVAEACIGGLIILFSFNCYWTFLVWSKFLTEIKGQKTSSEDE